MNRLISLFADLRLTVFCLLALFVLVFGGTLYQVEHGLYAAQKIFFESIGQAVLWVLFLNLLCGFFLQRKNLRAKPGLLISHIGVLLFFVSGFITLHLCEETQLMLPEGGGSNLSSSGQLWEIAAWPEEEPGRRSVTAVGAGRLSPGQPVEFRNLGFTLTLHQYFPNSRPHEGVLLPVPLDKEMEKNFPGASLALDGSQGDFLLWGGNEAPVRIESGGRRFQVALRRRRSVLPFTLKLVDFRKQIHPGTDMARSYESTVELRGKDFSRETVISMNEPLRYRNFTFYQASYAVDPQGNEYSTLAVVRNSGRLLPYIATFVLVGGLALHFAAMAGRLAPAKRRPALSNKGGAAR
jgi:hypothetical protein